MKNNYENILYLIDLIEEDLSKNYNHLTCDPFFNTAIDKKKL